MQGFVRKILPSVSEGKNFRKPEGLDIAGRNRARN